MKGETVKLILQNVSQNPINIYDVLEQRGYSRDKAWAYIPRLKRWGYIQQVGKSKYVLTEKGQKKLNRLLYGFTNCPYCGSKNVKLNGKRNRTGNQRYLCNSCGFSWTKGRREEALMRTLRKGNFCIIILACTQRFGLPVLQKLKAWMKADEEELGLGYLRRNVRVIVP